MLLKYFFRAGAMILFWSGGWVGGEMEEIKANLSLVEAEAELGKKELAKIK